MEEYGVVTAVEGGIALVSVERKAACEHCTAGTCDVSGETVVIEAVNEAEAKAGQRVRVKMVPYTYTAGSMLFYGVPALSLFVGAVLGATVMKPLMPSLDTDGASALAGFTFLALSVLAVRFIASRMEKKEALQPVVDSVIEDSPKGSPEG